MERGERVISAGDIDDSLAPRDELEHLLGSANIREYIRNAWLFIPCRTFFIPYGAGISHNGSRVYISYDVQTIIDGSDCASALVRHETTEWALRRFLDIGSDYLSDPRGHRLANRAEEQRVLALLDRENAWELYQEVIDPQVVLDERTEFDDKPIPRDLALYPYPEDLAERLKRAIYNDRSEEEWRKL